MSTASRVACLPPVAVRLQPNRQVQELSTGCSCSSAPLQVRPHAPASARSWRETLLASVAATIVKWLIKEPVPLRFGTDMGVSACQTKRQYRSEVRGATTRCRLRFSSAPMAQSSHSLCFPDLAGAVRRGGNRGEGSAHARRCKHRNAAGGPCNRTLSGRPCAVSAPHSAFRRAQLRPSDVAAFSSRDRRAVSAAFGVENRAISR